MPKTIDMTPRLGNCDACGAPIRSVVSEIVQEHHMSSEWWAAHGHPEAYHIVMPFVGADWKVTRTCSNGHETHENFSRFRDDV